MKLTESISIKIFALFSLLLFFTGCSFFNKYKNDKILLDFHLGMTMEEFDNHVANLVEDNDIPMWTTSYNTNILFEFRLFGYINGTVYDNSYEEYVEFNSFDGEAARLTSMKILIQKDSAGLKLSLRPEEKVELVNLFKEKHGESQANNSKDLLWGFPSAKEPKYTCRLDTINMLLTYSYNPLFLLPTLEKENDTAINSDKENLKKIL